MSAQVKRKKTDQKSFQNDNPVSAAPVKPKRVPQREYTDGFEHLKPRKGLVAVWRRR